MGENAPLNKNPTASASRPNVNTPRAESERRSAPLRTSRQTNATAMIAQHTTICTSPAGSKNAETSCVAVSVPSMPSPPIAK